jgi:pimeloyl-ACP methyl ester carboxylesterase
MYQDPENPAISRHFVNLGDRQVHFRVAGSGPPLLVLHQSPTSSAEMATELISFADHFTSIGVDTPGFGESDRLPESKPDITAFARALEDFLTALGIEQTLIYGFHTGAIIGFEFLRLFPDRCAAAVINGLVVFEGAELEDFLAHYNFMPPPTAAGEHMAWTWARLRDQRLFFPWYRKTPEARMAFDLPDADFQQPYAVDYLRAGDGGRTAYQAAFAYPTRQRMSDIDRPVFLLNYAQDPLAAHPERLDAWPDCVHREIFADPESLSERAMQAFVEHAPPPVDLRRASSGHFTGRLQKEIVNTEVGPVLVKFTAQGAWRPILLLHDAGASSQSLDALALDLASQCAGQRQIISVDLPGHGGTGALRLADYSAESIAQLLASVVAALGVADLDVLAFGAASIVAVALERSRSIAINMLLLVDPWLYSTEERARLAETYAPDLTPGQYGEHFFAAWTFARDSELFWPWNVCNTANALQRPPEILPEQTHARTVEALMAGMAFSRLVRALLSYAFADALAAVETPALIFARHGNGHEVRAAEAARICPGAIYNPLPATLSGWAGKIIESLESRE